MNPKRNRPARWLKRMVRRRKSPPQTFNGTIQTPAFKRRLNRILRKSFARGVMEPEESSSVQMIFATGLESAFTEMDMWFVQIAKEEGSK